MKAIFGQLLLIILILIAYHVIIMHATQDNDFAEFDDFDNEYIETEDSNSVPFSKIPIRKLNEAHQSENKDFIQDEDDGIVEDEDNEFEHFQDDEEFEGFDGGDIRDMPTDQKLSEPSLTVAKIPVQFRTHWDSYWMEMLMITGLIAYFVNFFVGKTQNSKLAHLWYSTHKSLLEDNFVLVGDDGKIDKDNLGLMKESESVYSLWCSGRTCCEGMLVELKMIKRQDIVALLTGLLKPQQDQVQIKIEITKGVMDTFVFCVGIKKTVTKLFKEYADLTKFCTVVSKPDERYNVPGGFSILSEIPESTAAMLDTRLITALHKYQRLIDFIHISDQYSGIIQPDDSSNLKQPDTKCMLMVGFYLPKNSDMDPIKPLLILVFYIMERLRVYRLSKEAKLKAEKNRLRVEEDFLKSTHVARAEAAAQRREEKRKLEKERVLSEDDPEKQRRWELKEQKRLAKKKAPKMKRLAVKSL